MKFSSIYYKLSVRRAKRVIGFREVGLLQLRSLHK